MEERRFYQGETFANYDRGELLADGLVHKLALCAAGNGDDAVSVAHGDNAVGSLAQAVAYLRSEVG